MISKPEGISKMMKSMQGLMGGGAQGGGGGPLFGGGAQQGQGGGMKDVNQAQLAKQMGLDPNNMPSAEDMQKQMQEMEGKLPKSFKKRF